MAEVPKSRTGGPTADLYVGVMTGTSLDAIDVAICRFDTGSRAVELVGFHTSAWLPEMQRLLYELATAKSIDIDTITRVPFLLAEQYAAVIAEALSAANLAASEIRAIGLHGQTVRHLPTPESVRGLGPVGATLQVGSGSALAALMGIDVVSDFRSADVALGGQGAPLVPMFDYTFLRDDKEDRLITNIGGISNVTWLEAGGSRSKVVAFDCGPGNMLLDAIAVEFLHAPYDCNGDCARTGTIDAELLSKFIEHPYFSAPPPKSTGRELFGREFLEPVSKRLQLGELSVSDALATLTELTARSITDSLRILRTTGAPITIVLSGGGARNAFLCERIQANAEHAMVTTSESFGIPVSAKEAIAFAFFAQAFVEDNVIHLPSTTGARRSTILGTLSKG